MLKLSDVSVVLNGIWITKCARWHRFSNQPNYEVNSIWLKLNVWEKTVFETVLLSGWINTDIHCIPILNIAQFVEHNTRYGYYLRDLMRTAKCERTSYCGVMTAARVVFLLIRRCLRRNSPIVFYFSSAHKNLPALLITWRHDNRNASFLSKKLLRHQSGEKTC